MYVAVAGVAATDRFPSAGVRWVRRFAATQPGRRVDPWAVYAAQATEVLLDAIARSDGTRASVLREVFATTVRNGLLGSFSFDANGDVSDMPVTIARIDRAGSDGKGARLTTVSVEHATGRPVAPKR